MTREEQRRGRIADIERAVHKLKTCDKEKLIAECCYSWGTSRRTVLEYVNILISALKIKQEGKSLRWVDEEHL